jgi:hypothetical protein
LLNLGVGHIVWTKSTDQVNNYKAICQLKDKRNKTGKPTQKLPSGKTTASDSACARNSPTTDFHQHPLIATRHSLKERSVVIHVQSQVKTTQACGHHAPNTIPQYRRSKQIPNQKAAANTAGRRVSSRRQWKSANRAFKKCGKRRTRPNSTVDTPGWPFSFRHLTSKLSCQNKEQENNITQTDYEKQTPTTGSNRRDKSSTTLMVGSLKPPQGKP